MFFCVCMSLFSLTRCAQLIAPCAISFSIVFSLGSIYSTLPFPSNKTSSLHLGLQKGVSVQLTNMPTSGRDCACLLMTCSGTLLLCTHNTQLNPFGTVSLFLVRDTMQPKLTQAYPLCTALSLLPSLLTQINSSHPHTHCACIL